MASIGSDIIQLDLAKSMYVAKVHVRSGNINSWQCVRAVIWLAKDAMQLRVYSSSVACLDSSKLMLQQLRWQPRAVIWL